MEQPNFNLKKNTPTIPDSEIDPNKEIIKKLIAELKQAKKEGNKVALQQYISNIDESNLPLVEVSDTEPDTQGQEVVQGVVQEDMLPELGSCTPTYTSNNINTGGYRIDELRENLKKLSISSLEEEIDQKIADLASSQQIEISEPDTLDTPEKSPVQEEVPQSPDEPVIDELSQPIQHSHGISGVKGEHTELKQCLSDNPINLIPNIIQYFATGPYFRSKDYKLVDYKAPGLLQQDFANRVSFVIGNSNKSRSLFEIVNDPKFATNIIHAFKPRNKLQSLKQMVDWNNCNSNLKIAAKNFKDFVNNNISFDNSENGNTKI